MTITIFSHNRLEMLRGIVKHLKGKVDLFIVDDFSEFNAEMFTRYADVYRSPEWRGKQEYWKQWNIALEYCNRKADDLYVFMPDDFQDLDIERIKKIHATLNRNGIPYLVNIINDGRESQFIPTKPIKVLIDNEPFLKVNWTDLGFFCNRSTLRVIGHLFPIDKTRWQHDNSLSSGVGQQITHKIQGQVNCYIPEVSMAFHSDHPSKMNPQERLKNPLISRH